VKRVDAKQLSDVCQLLKLRLQERQLPPTNIAPLLFSPPKDHHEISIAELKAKFDSLAVPAKKGLLLARYLVEPLHASEVVYNEDAKST
jgi:hypothetical protein